MSDDSINLLPEEFRPDEEGKNQRSAKRREIPLSDPPVEKTSRSAQSQSAAGDASSAASIKGKPKAKDHQQQSKPAPAPKTDSEKKNSPKTPVFDVGGGDEPYRFAPDDKKKDGSQSSAVNNTAKQTQPSKDKKDAEPPPKKHRFFGRSQKHINLIPQGASQTAGVNWREKLSLLGLVVILSLIVVGIAYSGILWYQIRVANDLQQVEEEIQGITALIEQEQVGLMQAKQLQQKLHLVENQFQRHIYWTQLLTAIEQTVTPDVFYTQFEATEEGTVVISAIGRNYQAAAEQLVALQRRADIFQTVTVNNVSRIAGPEALPPPLDESFLEHEPVSFVIRAEIAPSLLFPRI